MKSSFVKGLGLLVASSMFLAACGQVEEETVKVNGRSVDYEAEMAEARSTSFGKYPETITYTLGKMSGSNNSNLPEGDTYEDNAYTRLLLDTINVQNVDVFEAESDQYKVNVSMAIAQNQMPDIMLVDDLDQLQYLVDNDMIEDLTTYYDQCLSDRIKEMYASYGDQLMDLVTYDGKIMALPETNISDGPNLVWLRKDWMDELGLDGPETLEDLEEIVRQFITKDPGNNGAGETIGLAVVTDLCGETGYSSEYTLDIIFSVYDSYPKQWIYDEDGKVVYGSVTEQAKNALEHINAMYEEGIIDQGFLMRSSSNIIDLIVDGKCGSFFGPWWAPNNPLMDAMEANPDAEWVPYLIVTNEDGSTQYHTQNPCGKYVVVRKGYEYPEVLCKIISVLFDYERYSDNVTDEIRNYYKWNVDPTARPIAINVDYEDALQRCYRNLQAALTDEAKVDDLNLLEYSYYEVISGYVEKEETLQESEASSGTAKSGLELATSAEWAAYTSRITACQLLNDAKITEESSLYFGETESMANTWWNLQDLESETYLMIVTGEKDIDAFDEFVESWYANGGAQITKEVREELQ